MKFLVTFLVIVIYNFSVDAQTCIVVRKEQDEIYVGGDSRVLLLNYNKETNKNDTAISEMCKIFTTDTYSFAVAGLVTPLIIDSIFSSIKRGGSLEKIGDNCQISVLSELSYMDSIEINRNTHLNGVLFGIMIFGFERDTAKVLSIQFVLVKVGNKYELASKKRFIDSEDAMGHTFELIENNLLHNQLTWSSGPLVGIVKLIKEAIMYHPINVASPIDILKVSREGKKWIQKKESCR